jgi:CcmD family protein
MSGGDYLAAAYLVVFFVVLVYVLIIALKLARLDRDLAALAERARRRREETPDREEARVG